MARLLEFQTRSFGELFFHPGLSGATVGVGLRYSMKGLALAVPAKLTAASAAATPRREHEDEDERDEWSVKRLWRQRTAQAYSQASARAS